VRKEKEPMLSDSKKKQPWVCRSAGNIGHGDHRQGSPATGLKCGKRRGGPSKAFLSRREQVVHHLLGDERLTTGSKDEPSRRGVPVDPKTIWRVISVGVKGADK